MNTSSHIGHQSNTRRAPPQSAMDDWENGDQWKRRKMLENIGKLAWRALSGKSFNELPADVVDDLNFAFRVTTGKVKPS